MADDVTPSPADAAPDRVGELDRMVERGSLFTHAAFERIAARSTRIERELHDLVGTLRAAGVVPAEVALPEGDPAPGGAGEPDGSPEGVPWPTIAMRAEGARPDPTREVNCGERMHVCHAVCCKLHFALTGGEVDAGAVRFDLGWPYMIRHDRDGYCTHNDRATGFCGVYADRPGICRKYSCAGDERIWKDFDAMELNHEWLDANLGPAQRIRLRLDLPLMDPDQA
ncbi:MAG TPA: hypothetical protein VFW71_05410 [Actinomycetota bacterium]|nr:hypothetical protein [Actinomycetota bacterium]